MRFRVKDFLIGLIPFKKYRKKLRYTSGTFPYCSVSKSANVGNPAKIIGYRDIEVYERLCAENKFAFLDGSVKISRRKVDSFQDYLK